MFQVRFFDPHKAFNRAFGRRIPTHHISDELTWIRGRHTLQAGTNLRFIRNDRFSDERSFPQYLVNLGLCLNFCRDAFATLLADGDPNNNPADFVSFVSSYLMLTGSITTLTANFFVDPNTLSFLPLGTPQARSFAENDLEFYFQDSWRLKPNLTLTAGVRYSYFGPVWEKHGLQVRPALDVGDWWGQRVLAAERGLPTDTVEPLSFILAGKANDAPAWYDPDKNNWAPRLALAWSPGFQHRIGRFLFGVGGKSSVRLGAGVFFHRVGGALAVSNDSFGSPGLDNFLANPVNQFGLADAPRFSGACNAGGCTGLPPVGIFLTIPTPTFPATPSLLTDNAGVLVDDNLKTPYSLDVDSSFQREIIGTTFEAAYVGTFGRQLLVRSDFAQVMWNFRDPVSAMTLEEAFNRIVDLIGPDPFNPRIDPSGPGVFAIPAIPFFENTMPNLAGRSIGGSATQEFYVLATRFAPSWTDVLFLLDVNLPLAGFSPWRFALDPEGNGLPGPGVPGRVLFQQQFNGLLGWINSGSSSYHSFQLSARRAMGSLVFNANYVISKSIDNGSSGENADFVSPFIGLGLLPNALRPKAHRAVSDFDLRHNFNANWVVELPFGSGRVLGRNASGSLERLIGGWQVAGTWRWRSGFPLSPGNGFFFPTNFSDPGSGTVIASLTSSVTRGAPGGPNLFSDPEAARRSIAFTRPGAVGSRNVIRSDAFFSIDLGIAKTFALGKMARLQFRLEAFNVLNNVNFDTDPGGSPFPTLNNLDPTAPAVFGRFTNTAGGFPQQGAREMQFVLRLDF